VSQELVKVSTVSVPAPGTGPDLPLLVERAGGAARFAWDEYFYAEHHNPHTQKAYMRAVKRFMAWAEREGVDLAAITPGMVGQYLVGLGGSPAKRNLHLSALRGFFDRMVNRHVCILNPAASVKGVKEQVIEGKTPEIGVERGRTLLASTDCGHVVGLRGDPRHAGLYRLPGRGGCQAPPGRLPQRRDATHAAVPRKRRQEPRNPGAARPGRLYTGLHRVEHRTAGRER
jgi:integrase/recombinase XerD